MIYIIRVYSCITGKYVTTLPYRFKIMPYNIVWQLNEMFKHQYNHIISVEETE